MENTTETNCYKCCFTGYRPSKFPFELSAGNADYIKFENALTEQITELAHEGCRVFYTGMAMGFDIIAAEIVLMLKNAFSKPLKLICVLPFENQSDNFGDCWKKRYYSVLDNADEVKILSENYSPECYQKRNEYMVDNSDFVITWYDGRQGGTKNTINYALKRGRKVFNTNCDSGDTPKARQIEFELI